MNKIANPFVRFILHSPLHGWMSGALVLIKYRGRKSGREYSLPVQYAGENESVIIIPGMPEKKVWWRNLRGGAPVKLTLRGKVVPGQANVLEGEADAGKIADALRTYLVRFPQAAKMHGVHQNINGDYNEKDLQQATRSTVVVRVEFEQE